MNLKKILQAPMRRRQTLKYENRIVSQTVAYHDWILKKEQQEREGSVLLGQELSMEYIAYRLFCQTSKGAAGLCGRG